MKFQLHLPEPPLSEFIEYFFFYTENQPDHLLERLMPDGAVEMIIDLTEPPKRFYHNDNLDSFDNFRCAWISGMRSRYITIDATGETMIVVRFKPGGAGAFFDFPLSEISDSVIPLDQILGNIICDLRDKLAELPTAEAKFAALSQFFLDRRRERHLLHPAIRFALQLVRQHPASLTVKQISESCGISQKHFIQQFRRSVGQTPKTYSRIMKFQNVLRQIHAEQTIEWAQVAYACDYYDQSHFISEFKRFSGINPTAYLSHRFSTNGLPREELYLSYLSVHPR